MTGALRQGWPMTRSLLPLTHREPSVSRLAGRSSWPCRRRVRGVVGPWLVLCTQYSGDTALHYSSVPQTNNSTARYIGRLLEAHHRMDTAAEPATISAWGQGRQTEERGRPGSYPSFVGQHRPQSTAASAPPWARSNTRSYLHMYVRCFLSSSQIKFQ